MLIHMYVTPVAVKPKNVMPPPTGIADTERNMEGMQNALNATDMPPDAAAPNLLTQLLLLLLLLLRRPLVPQVSATTV